MSKVEEFKDAAKALFLFTPYTTLNRRMEIAMGILAWTLLSGLVFIFIKN